MKRPAELADELLWLASKDSSRKESSECAVELRFGVEK
jgi:hypothetical protein